MSTAKRLFRRAGWMSLRRRSQPPVRGRTRLHVESLEDRTVLSPTLFDPNLGVRTVVSGLTQATSMAFLGANDFFILSKTLGTVTHVINGVSDTTSFNFGAGPIPNLPVNNASERGLLGIALSPNFANDHDVYLYWTMSTTGMVDNVTNDVPLLGNRVDRFIWNAATSTFTFDKNIIQLHAFQNDGNGGNTAQEQGNHNGGVIQFGPDGKLYIVIGDNGRRGWLQNLVNGPQGPGQTDENNGPVQLPPTPSDPHLTGVVLRLNPDGSVPDDNPFVGISNTLSASVLSGADTAGIGSFTAFLDQSAQTFAIHPFFQNLTGQTIAGQIRYGSPDGPVLFTVPDFPTGVTSGEFNTTLTAANFVAEPPVGINTLADGINAVLTGQAYFSIYTTQFPTAAISGQITQLDPEITNNLHKIFAYGVRNSFGYAFDPVTGHMWLEEDGDNSFDKISIVAPGSNNGWIQSSAPLFNFDGTPDETAIQEFKSIEVSTNGLQQSRYAPTNISDTVQDALNRLLMLPGAHYNPAVFSVRAEDPPAGLGFMTTDALGPEYDGALFEGEARDNNGGPFSDPREQYNGALLVFHPNADRTGIDFEGDPNIRTSEGVLTNNADFDLMGDTTIVLGRDFGVVSDIQTGPDGNLYVVSLSGGVNIPNGGSVFEIFRQSAVSPFQSANLVSDVPNLATITDPKLVNPWGISFSSSSPFWVADEGSSFSTLYSGTDETNVMKASTEVAVPFATGTVNNSSSTDFLLSNGQSARFLFDSLDGSIYGWNGGASAEQAVNIPGAVYTGLTLANNGVGNYLYAANVSQGTIDVFDSGFNEVSGGPAQFVFADPNLPAGLTSWKPFNIQNLDGTLYVTYRNSANPEHGGIVDAFDTNGDFLGRVVSGGLNAPWGLALAPAGFGPYGGALLVGNFGLGDGKINAYDPGTGQFLGYLTDADGNPLQIEGLWALAFGNGGSGGDPNTLYFASGLNRTGPGSFSAQDGLFGLIRFTGPTTAGSKEPFDPASGVIGADLVSAVRDPVSVNPPTLSATTNEPSPATVPALLLANVQSIDQVFSSTQHQDQGFVTTGAKPAPTSGDDLGLTLFQADDTLPLA